MRMAIGIILGVIGIFVLAQINFFLLGLGIILLITGLIGFCPIDYYFHLKQRS